MLCLQGLQYTDCIPFKGVKTLHHKKKVFLGMILNCIQSLSFDYLLQMKFLLSLVKPEKDGHSVRIKHTSHGLLADIVNQYTIAQ